jgi:hypothetical protein
LVSKRISVFQIEEEWLNMVRNQVKNITSAFQPVTSFMRLPRHQPPPVLTPRGIVVKSTLHVYFGFGLPARAASACCVPAGRRTIRNS